MTINRLVAGALLAIGILLFLHAPSANAHAELTSSDPPADGLLLSPPDTISLRFSEEVEPSNPPPIVTLLDEDGNTVGQDPLPVVESDDRRTLTVSIPEIDRGTWTVSWTVTSATDGHTLSGTFAFRVGGGLPPGLAATPDDIPAIWAVATRWITFLGAALAAGLFLFGELVVGDRPSSSRWRRWRIRGILAGAIVALIATLSEPILQWAFDRPTSSTTLMDMVRGLPDGWWWRPAMLIPLTLLATVVAWPLKERIARPIAWLGGLLALGSLLGLVMTSHAAGRATWRWAAIATDLAHQWSVALWTGGLAALVIWRSVRGEDGPALHLRRFSATALGLFAVAVVTGLVNTGFVFSLVNRIQDDGWSKAAFEPLWSSNYGVVLIAKLLLLLVPLALAIYHRALVARLADGAIRSIGELPGRFRQTLRWELAAVAVVVAGGVTLALSTPPSQVEPAIDKITLVASTSVDPGPDSMLAHLTIDPADAGDNAITVRLTDWDGNPVADDPVPRVVLSFASLDHGTESGGIGMEPIAETPGSYGTSGLNLSLDGWWQIDATIQRAGQQNQFATFYTLLPDPNTQGFDAPPKPATDPDAETLFTTALNQMLAWQRVRWTEDLSSGNDALVRARFSVVAGGSDTPPASTLDVVYSGGFEPFANGEPPRPPTYNTRSSITVGDQAWLQSSDGQWLDEPASPVSVPSEWGSTYEGATNFRMGTTQTTDGTTYQVITLYLPEETGRAEAWLAWWIDTDTGNVMKMTMTARMHYMVWTYSDIDGDFTIEPPTASS